MIVVWIDLIVEVFYFPKHTKYSQEYLATVAAVCNIVSPIYDTHMYKYLV